MAVGEVRRGNARHHGEGARLTAELSPAVCEPDVEAAQMGLHGSFGQPAPERGMRRNGGDHRAGPARKSFVTSRLPSGDGYSLSFVSPWLVCCRRVLRGMVWWDSDFACVVPVSVKRN